jgi:16S rRNA (uracil1498-N3)-methyltransferase
VAPGSAKSGRLCLHAEDAARALRLGLREGSPLVALDDSGWELDVRLESLSDAGGEGQILGRRLAEERRSKVSLYQGLLHPSDFRRLLAAATALGVVAFVPVITDGSVVPMLGPDGAPEGELEWPALVREAAEASGRGHRPVVGSPMLFDQALDQAARGGSGLLIDPSGGPLAEALAGRPFSIDLFLPPPGGFTEEERRRTRARNLRIVAPPQAGPDPIQPALSTLDRLYAILEELSSED